MATTIDLAVRCGDTLEAASPCPTPVRSSSPYVRWTIPEGIVQRRFNIRIESLEDGQTGLFVLGATSSSSTWWRYPSASPMTSQFAGLCEVEIALSSNTSGDFEYTSGPVLMVYDPDGEYLYNVEEVNLSWDRSIDPDYGQTITYRVDLASNPSFSPILDTTQVVDAGQARMSTVFSGLSVGDFYWKVRANDGYDDSQWSRTNAFSIRSDVPPEITITEVVVTDNDYGDVVIRGTVNDIEGGPSEISITYTDGLSTMVCSLVEPLSYLPNGDWETTWRTTRNEDGSVSCSITATARDENGNEASATHAPIVFDNTGKDIDDGGFGGREMSFPLSVGMAVVDDGTEVSSHYPVSALIGARPSGFEMVASPVVCSEETWRIYAERLIDPVLRDYEIGTYFSLKTPLGMVHPNVPTWFTDLDSSDPMFTRNPDVVGSDGWRIMVDEVAFAKEGSRFGYLRFYDVIISGNALCQECSGAGWMVDDLIDNGDGTYTRTPCPYCGGSRFSTTRLDNAREFMISRYEPIVSWISPTCIGSHSVGAIDTPGVERGWQHIFGNEGRDPDPWPTSQRFPNRSYQKDGGMDSGIPLDSAMAVTTDHVYEPGHMMPVDGAIGPEAVVIEDHMSPVDIELVEGRTDYLSGLNPDMSPGMSVRPSGTHVWEAGIFPFQCHISKPTSIEPFSLIYLQSGWDIYNTIHWTGNPSPTTGVQMQSAKILEDGSVDQWVDIVPDGGEYSDDLGGWIGGSGEWHAYWSRTDTPNVTSGSQYKLRARQFDSLTKTSSQWVTSHKFSISDTAPNPPNVTSVEYEPWNSKVFIKFRLDDTDLDRYDISRVWYNVDGGDFIRIDNGHLSGEKHAIASGGGLDHTLIWNASAYSLDPSLSYRVMIEVIPSYVIAGITPPVLKWALELNPTRKSAEIELIDINGQAQIYSYDDDGNLEKLDSPVLVPGSVQMLEDKLNEFQMSPAPSGVFTYMSGWEITNPSGYENWMSSEVVPGVTRADVVNGYTSKIDELLNDRVPVVMDAIGGAERDVREYLIEQGFYCNGFNDNDPNEGWFKFSVESMDRSPDIIVDDEYEILYDDRYEVYHRVQMDFLDTFDSQDGSPLRDFITDEDGERFKGAVAGTVATNVNGDLIDLSSVVYENAFDQSSEVGDWTGETEASGEIESIERESASDVASLAIQTFGIPATMLPGEVDGDSLPPGFDSFETSYHWRVRSYNLIDGEPVEKPMASSVSAELLASPKRLSVTFNLSGDEAAQAGDVDAVFYAFGTSSGSPENLTEVEFPTDLPSGYTHDQDSPIVWVPGGTSRNSPMVLMDSHERIMFYSKADSRGRHVVMMAMSKDGDTFGEHSQITPAAQGEFTGIMSRPCVTHESDWKMWATESATSWGSRISVFSSADGKEWSRHSVVSGLRASPYAPCVIEDDGSYLMWYCAIDGSLSKVFLASSSDGISWSGLNLGNPVLSSSGHINTPCVIKNESGYTMAFTQYDGYDYDIFSCSSTDGISWTAPSLLLEDARNPWLMASYKYGHESLALYYNVDDGSGGDKIMRGDIQNISWNAASEYHASQYCSNYANLSSSVDGISHTMTVDLEDGDVVAALRNITSTSNLLIGLDVSNHADTRYYMVASEWQTPDVAPDNGGMMTPPSFVYAEDMKSIPYREGYGQ